MINIRREKINCFSFTLYVRWLLLTGFHFFFSFYLILPIPSADAKQTSSQHVKYQRKVEKRKNDTNIMVILTVSKFYWWKRCKWFNSLSPFADVDCSSNTRCSVQLFFKWIFILRRIIFYQLSLEEYIVWFI